MPTFVYFGDRFQSSNNDSSAASLIREEMTSWVVIDSSAYGRSSREGMARFQDDVLLYNPDLVAIMFGIHDARTPNSVPIEEFSANLRYMVKRLLPSETILISPILHESEKQPGMNALIQNYCKEMKRVASETGSMYLDLCSLNGECSNIQDVLAKKLLHELVKKETHAENRKSLFQKFNLRSYRVF